jgi:hypothetical protein
MIISFTSPPTLYSISHSRVDVSEDEDFYMGNDDDLEAENATITTPGESITSARAFMRCEVFPRGPVLSHDSFQGTWHLRG